jgi:hypothetical protein
VSADKPRRAGQPVYPKPGLRLVQSPDPRPAPAPDSDSAVTPEGLKLRYREWCAWMGREPDDDDVA